MSEGESFRSGVGASIRTVIDAVIVKVGQRLQKPKARAVHLSAVSLRESDPAEPRENNKSHTLAKSHPFFPEWRPVDSGILEKLNV